MNLVQKLIFFSKQMFLFQDTLLLRRMKTESLLKFVNFVRSIGETSKQEYKRSSSPNTTLQDIHICSAYRLINLFSISIHKHLTLRKFLEERFLRNNAFRSMNSTRTNLPFVNHLRNNCNGSSRIDVAPCCFPSWQRLYNAIHFCTNFFTRTLTFNLHPEIFYFTISFRNRQPFQNIKSYIEWENFVLPNLHGSTGLKS